MTVKVGDEFLALATGTVYVVHAVSKHGTFIMWKTRNLNDHIDQEWVIHTNPDRIEGLILCLKNKLWVPNTPAARTLYVSKTKV